MTRTFFIAAIVLALAVGGWYWNRTSQRSADRERILELARGNRSAAIEDVQRYAAAHPDDRDVLQASVEFRLRCVPDHPSLDSDLDRLVNLRPDDAAIRQRRLARRAAKGLHDGALDDALHLKRLAPDDPAAHIAIVNLAQSTGRSAEAIDSLTALLKLRPDAREDYGELLAKAYWETGQPARARAALEAHVPPSSGRPLATMIRGLLYLDDRRHDDAVRLLREAANRPEQRSMALFHLTNALTAAERPAEARAALRELEQVKDRERLLADARQRTADPALQVRAARAMLLEGRPRDAAVLMEHAIARHGVRDEFREPLAEAYRQLGRAELAAQWQKKPPR